MITVTKTYLPPLEEYTDKLKIIWENGHVTNNGIFVRELELKLKEYLGVKHLFLTANGTLGLQLALKALNISKKVITTPFSYVATTNSILWENAMPIFVDINPEDCCIDPIKVESAIDDDTQAILATHVYGHACDVNSLKKIACKKGIKIIYDAAHAFGSKLEGKSLVSYGDVSVLSFHATKLFHTIEGGAVVTNDDKYAERIKLYRSFGHIGDEYFSVGINAKLSEIHAAMGLCMLPKIPNILNYHRKLCLEYDALLIDLPLQRLRNTNTELEYNYAYYPIVFSTQEIMLHAKLSLESEGIYPRRYFYPPLNRLPFFHGESCVFAEDISTRVLCLPLSNMVTLEIQEKIYKILKKCLVA